MVLNYDLPESPYLKANPCSRLFFCWVIKLFSLGNKQDLALKDLYKVNPQDEAKYLGDKLGEEWRKEVAIVKQKNVILLTKLHNKQHHTSHEHEHGDDNAVEMEKKRKEWIKKQLHHPSLSRAITKCFGPSFALYGLLAFCEECIFKIGGPIALGYLIKYFNDPTLYPSWFGYVTAAAVCLATAFINLVTHPYFFGVTYYGMRVRVACCSLLYRKAVKLSQASLEKTAIGQLVNLLSSDVNRLENVSMFIHYLWIGPLQTILATIVIYFYIGWSCFLGLALLVLYVPFQACMGHRFSSLRIHYVEKKDTRIRLMSEIVGGIKIIKMYTWETPFAKLVDSARKDEVGILGKTSYLRAVNLTFFLMSTKIIVFLTLILYVQLGNELSAEKVFVLLVLYDNVRLVMTFHFPNCIAVLAEVQISLKRLTEFLTMEEQTCDSVPIIDIDETEAFPIPPPTPHNKQQHQVQQAEAEQVQQLPQQQQQQQDGEQQLKQLVETESEELAVGVALHNVAAKWDRSLEENTIENISLAVKMGQTMAITGPVGSGKGTILNVILRELPIVKGRLEIHGKISYAPQEPWLFSGSVRENILFGCPYKPEWYAQVVEACALTTDFDLFPFGDGTLIGEKGNTLSGGQKARISFARAVYANADILLLDDPLAAVDTKVGQILFDTISKGILASKARILVTHQLQVMECVDYIIILENGRIKEEGSYKQLVKRGINFSKMAKDYQASKIKEQNIEVEKKRSSADGTPPVPRHLNHRFSSIIIRNQIRGQKQDTNPNPNNNNMNMKRGPVVTVAGTGTGTGRRASVPNYRRNSRPPPPSNSNKRRISSSNTKKGSALGKFPNQHRPSQNVNVKPVVDNEKKMERKREVSVHIAAETPKTEVTEAVEATTKKLEEDSKKSDVIVTSKPSNQQNAVPLEERASEAPVETEEESAKGRVSLGLFLKYFTVGSNFFVILLFVILSLFYQVLYAATDFWLAIWTSKEEARSKNRTIKAFASKKSGPLYYIYQDREVQRWGFTMLCIVLVFLSIFRNFLFYCMCMNSSIHLHRNMFNGILRAPVAFFDANSAGRILNRFSKDMSTIDDDLPPAYFDVVLISLMILSVVIVIAVVRPYLIIPAVVCCIVFYFLRKFYVRTARGIKRLEGIARSPIFSHMSTTLFGIATIRAFRKEDNFIRQFERHLDLHTSAWYLCLATTRAFAIWLDWISSFYITCVTFTFLLTGAEGSQVGLAISTALTLTGMLQWGVRQSAELESMLVCVERVLEYTHIVPEAALLSAPDKKPPDGWPRKGEIVFENVSLKYGDNPPVLKDINCVIQPAEKVGIVGRTGAGKSTLITVLFRMSEPTGKIIIDGVDVTQIGLHDLRSKISIIPQDPFLFSGTVRRNLDPFDNHCDSEIWNALEKAHIAKDVRCLPACLSAPVAEGGSNFSVGQRQLLCLARAILSSNKILVLDEATANVDLHTDHLIQATLKKIAKDCTVLSVAHRLHTVMDCDRMVVLDAGRIMEFEEPHKLLQDSTSILRSLIDQTGNDMAEELKSQAKAAYDKRHGIKAVTYPSDTGPQRTDS